MKAHMKKATTKAEEAITAIIEDEWFETNCPEAVAALLRATRELINASKKETA